MRRNRCASNHRGATARLLQLGVRELAGPERNPRSPVFSSPKRASTRKAAASRRTPRRGSSLNARGNSTIVGVSFEAKTRVVRAFERKAENDVKKKIRAIQYGVGPSAHPLRG